MNPIRRLLRELARFTDPGAPAQRRLAERLRAVEPDPDATRALLGQLPDPDPWAQLRVQRRVEDTLARAPSRWHRSRPLALGLALASALLVIVAVRGGAGPLPLDLEIAASTESAIDLAEHVDLVAKGRGHAAGTDAAPRLRWEEGSLSVEVTPERGIDLEVVTDEAIVRVLGTGFTVERSALGTQVSVRHGQVSVDCVAGDGHRLTTGQSVECAPVRPPALLGRARALAGMGAAPERVLSTLDAAENKENSPALAGELLALRVDTLRRAGRSAEALGAAQDYLQAGHLPRRPDMRRIAAALLFERSGCEAALPLLREAVLDGGGPEDAAALAACEAQHALR